MCTGRWARAVARDEPKSSPKARRQRRLRKIGVTDVRTWISVKRTAVRLQADDRLSRRACLEGRACAPGCGLCANAGQAAGVARQARGIRGCRARATRRRGRPRVALRSITLAALSGEDSVVWQAHEPHRRRSGIDGRRNAARSAAAPNHATRVRAAVEERQASCVGRYARQSPACRGRRRFGVADQGARD